MTVFWVLTTIPKKDNAGFAQFYIDTPFQTIDEIGAALKNDGVLVCDKVFVEGPRGEKRIMSRERFMFGKAAVVTIQKPITQPIPESGQ